MPLYAAYATNLDARQMTRRAPHSPLRGTGWLSGWRLTFGGEHLGWEGSLATVVEDEKEQVFVSLYDVSPVDEEGLDRWEGVQLGIYRRTRLRAQTLDGDVPVWTYVLNDYEGGLAGGPLPGPGRGRGGEQPAPPTTTCWTCAAVPAETSLEVAPGRGPFPPPRSCTFTPSG